MTASNVLAMTEIRVVERPPPDAPEASAPPEPCRNCGAPVADRFCPRCGQPAADRIVSLRRMTAEFVDDQFTLNATVPRTLAALFLRPGFLTREYVAGRVFRYVRPFRLFLVAVVAFFLAVSWATDGATIWQSLTDQGDGTEWMEEVADTPARDLENFHVVTFGVDTTSVPGWLLPAARRLQAQEDRLNAMTPRQAFALIIDAALQAASRVAFLLVPAFAALLKLLHLFRRRLFAEHFVFALHVHAVAFATLALALLVAHPFLWWVAGVYLPLYLLVAMKRAYAQPWTLAALKLVLLAIVYPAVLGLAAAAAFLLAIVVA